MAIVRPFLAGRRAAGLLGICAGVLAWSAAAGDAQLYRIAVSAPTTFTLPADEAAGGDYRRLPGGSWTPLETSRQPGGPLTVALHPDDCGPSGEALILLGKPEWMSLDDDTPPRVAGVTVNGTALPVAGNHLALGAIPGDQTEIVVAIEDAASPLAVESIGFRLASGAGEAIQIDRSGLQPLQRQGSLTLRLTGLPPGAYDGELILADRAAAANRAVHTIAFTVFGIAIDADRQSVTLVGSGPAYRLQPHLSEQLLLPGGVWAKLTTRTAGTWLYPRRFTEIAWRRDTAVEKCIAITADTQGIDGKPIDGMGIIEYELTVRADSPALLVHTRSVNASKADAENSANWGWLPAPYYVVPEGRQDWRGRAANRYLEVGRVGWVWLAPTRPSAPGIAWLSPFLFGESRFDTMLLYSDTATNKPGEGVDIRFAVAPADSPEETAALYRDLVAKGLLPEVSPEAAP